MTSEGLHSLRSHPLRHRDKARRGFTRYLYGGESGGLNHFILNKLNKTNAFKKELADGVGFEPTKRLHFCQFSRLVDIT